MEALSIKRLSANRQIEREYWAAVRDICCRTGDNGRPIAAERWEFFAKVWIEPYEKLLPDWTYAAIRDNAVVGYLTGCPDSVKFARTKAWRCEFPLLLQVGFGRHRHTPGGRAHARRVLGLGKVGERRFSRELKHTLETHYPAHLHINVDEEFRGLGIGRLLIETYIADLRTDGVGGLHLFCGADPVAFYRRLDFEILESVQLGNAPIFALGRRL
jgi:GNAT superfamily N-acetyltransferase